MLYHNIISTLILMMCLSCSSVFAQSYDLKRVVEADEAERLKMIVDEIAQKDQLYRSYLQRGTTDDAVLARIDSVYEEAGFEAMMAYERSLNLELDPSVRDSLWKLQQMEDLGNHMKLRGIFDAYGYLPEEMLGKNFTMQMVVLLHPPADWNIDQYLEEYSELLIKEVKAGRMPAKAYATFFDNIRIKILGEPQLYGTNQVYSRSQGKVLPPEIVDLEKSNAARMAIGLEPLTEGEYRLMGE
ncbi:MAG: hypothetical protein AAFY71_09600 [Bacteroidota bacterium]